MKWSFDTNLVCCPRCGMPNPLLVKIVMEFEKTEAHDAFTTLTYHCNGCELAPELTGDFEIYHVQAPPLPSQLETKKHL